MQAELTVEVNAAEPDVGVGTVVVLGTLPVVDAELFLGPEPGAIPQ